MDRETHLKRSDKKSKIGENHSQDAAYEQKNQ